MTSSAEPLRILVCLLYYLPHRTGLTLYVHPAARPAPAIDRRAAL